MPSKIFCPIMIASSLVGGSLVAQQTTVSAPWIGVGDSYYEQVGIGWGVQQITPNGGFFFRSGGGVLPPFGGFDPNAQTAFGLGGRSGGLDWNFRVLASQGSNRGLVSTTPSITIPNGGFGFISDTVQFPFVTAIVPVVGSRVVSPLEERLFRLRFEEAARSASQTSAAARQAEEDELAAARNRQPRSPKLDDPPLILKRRTDETASRR